MSRVLWIMAFLGLWMLPLQAGAEEIPEGESPVCPGRPFVVQPTEKDVAELGLSLEMLCVIGDTYLFRHDLPGPEESPDLLRRYLRQGPYQNLSGAEYIAVMEEAVRLWPESRYAHAGLAWALLGGRAGGHSAPRDPADADTRRAAQELLKGGEIALSRGDVPYYLAQLQDLLASVGDREALDRFFQQVFEVVPEGMGRWKSYREYAQALAKLGDARAETFFRKAIEVSPEGVEGESYTVYARYLLDHGKAQAALDVLDNDPKARRLIGEDVFHHQRCQALERLGRGAEAEVECRRAREVHPFKGRPPSPAGRPVEGPSDPESRAPSGRGLLSRWLGGGLAYAWTPHDNISDDCRFSHGCAKHPDDPAWCYFYFTWNLAELIEEEAGAETYGSRAAVGWTVRDRVSRGSTTECFAFGGARGDCTSICPDPYYCTWQKKYCCVIHAEGQFNVPHQPFVDIDVRNLQLAASIIGGFMPEPTSGYIPAGAYPCTTNACDIRLGCVWPGDEFQYAPNGPIYFYGNYADSSYRCKGFQELIPSSCNVVAKETCGDSPDGAPRYSRDADNCYGRATRNRPWKAGPNFSGSAGVTTSGDAKRIPAGAFIYKAPGFKKPGGKELVVEARLETAGQANLRVVLKNSSGAVIYDFGTIAVTSTTYSSMTFTSTIVVTSAGNRVDIKNEGPGVVFAQGIIARD